MGEGLLCDKVPRAVADEVVRVLPRRTLKYLTPVLQVLPRLIHSRPRKRREASQRLEQHATQTPVVDRELVFVALEHLRGHVVRRPDNGLCVVDVPVAHGPVALAALGDGALLHGLAEGDRGLADLLELDAHGFYLARGEEAGGEAEVGEFDVAGGVDEEVLGLQVSVDIAELVQGIDRAEHFGDVEAGVAVGQDAGVVQKSPEISSRNILL